MSAARALPLLAIAGLLAFSGCINPTPTGVSAPGPVAPDLSQALFKVLDGESLFYSASADRAQLHLRLWRPEAPSDWKAPTILVMSPYFGPDSREGADPNNPTTWDPAARPDYWRYQWLIDHFVPRGYAVALADVRGTGESGGCLEQTGPLQSQDGYDTVEYLAAQPWSNGRVGMYGKSYDAETQQSTATLAPPHLATIIPVSSVAGQYDYSYYDGVPYTLQTLFTNVFYAADDGLQPGSTREAHLALPTRVGCHVGHFAQGLDDSGDWNTYWEEREFRVNADKVEASVLYVHGLQDWNVKPSNIRDWFERLDAPKLALLGQWAHDYPEENRYEAAWSRQDWQMLVWRWYDHWLLDRDTGVDELLGQVQIQDSAGRWRTQTAFPPETATAVQYFLSGETLAAEPGSSTARTYKESPIPNPSGELDARLLPDGLLYRSEPLAAPVHWSGWPWLSMEVVLDKDDAHFAVHLLDIDAAGKETWVNRAYLSAFHREGVKAAKPVPIGERVNYDLRFFPSDTVIPAGHRIGLRLLPSDAWTNGADNGHTATVSGGVLTLPAVEPSPESFLDVPLGSPIRKPVVE